jgi:predicted ATP-grasp superfamily ATP-dependent carboligase
VKRARVLITNANSDAGLSAACSLVRAGYEVSSADAVDMPFGAKSRFIDGHHVLANGTPDAYASSLLALVDRIRPDVLLPLGQQSTEGSAAMHEQLCAITALNVAGSEAIAAANDKQISSASLEALGIPCAQVLSCDDAVAALATDPELTLVVKPRANLGSARGVRYVKSRGDLDDALAECRACYGEPLIQEFVPGGPESVKTAILLYSGESRLVAAFTAVKRRQWPTTGGLTVVSTSTRDEALVEQVKPFFQHWKWRGPAEVEFKHDARTGENKVIEINPRFPAYLRFAGHCGLDLPTIAVRIALDRDVRPLAYPSYRVGVTYVNPGLLIRTAAWHARHSGLAELPEIISQFGAGSQCAAGLLRDPIPVFGRILGGLINPMTT